MLHEPSIEPCVGCGKGFYRRMKSQKFCDPKCQKQTRKREYTVANPHGGIARGTVGAISEIVVCADLLKRGYDVFRSVSPHASCDLVAIRQGVVCRVEVRSGWITASGQASYCKKPGDSDKSDTVAIVLSSDEVIYQPSLAEVFP